MDYSHTNAVVNWEQNRQRKDLRTPFTEGRVGEGDSTTFHVGVLQYWLFLPGHLLYKLQAAMSQPGRLH